MVQIVRFIEKDAQESRLGRYIWSVPRLIELTRGLPVLRIPLQHLNVYYTYDSMTLRQMAGHIQAVKDADLSYPIILDEDGDVMDGRHRITKALLKGKKHILAVRFEVNPSPCRELDDDG